jgi:NAD(P)-dependent dehydrogenase (short-subunit alcohol dehydrogenase family)
VPEAVEDLGAGTCPGRGPAAHLSLADMEAAYRQVIERHGHLDAVVANAGVGDSAPLGSITEKQFDFIFGVNAKGVLFTVQAALPLLPAGGTVVIIGSTASIQAGPGMSLYSGSKAAIRASVRSWIQEIKGTGVRINVLSPGAVDTPSLRIALAGALGADQVQAQVNKMGEGNPTGRLPTRGRWARPRCSCPATRPATSLGWSCSSTAAWPRPADGGGTQRHVRSGSRRAGEAIISLACPTSPNATPPTEP